MRVRIAPTLMTALITALCATVPPSIAIAKVLEVGKRAPDFSLRDQSQALIRYSRLGRDQVVVLDFFRTDCAPCRKGLPKLVRLHDRYKGKNVKVVLIALLEEEQGEEKLERFFKRNRVPFPVLLDAYGTVAKKYISKGRGNVQLPSLFVIDKGGVVRLRHQSLLSELKPLTTIIDKLL